MADSEAMAGTDGQRAVRAVVDGLGTRVLFGSIVQVLDFRRAREAVGPRQVSTVC
jgi:hypothetical protein